MSMEGMARFLTRRSRGFSLIELITVVAIIGILARLALAGYDYNMRKSRRTEAKAAVTQTAQRLERCYTQYSSYNNNNCPITVTAFNSTPNSYYSIAVNFCTISPSTAGCTAAAAGTGTSYFITATAQGRQLKDTECRKFFMDNIGSRTSQNSSSATSTCW